MSYSSRKRYKSRREKNKIANRNFKLVVLGFFLITLLILFRYRVSIMDYLGTYFY